AFQGVSASVTNCKEGQLDVDYFAFSSQFLPVISGSIESRRREAASPQDSAHAEPPKMFMLTPVAGYNAADHLFGGARLAIVQPAPRCAESPVSEESPPNPGNSAVTPSSTATRSDTCSK